MLDNFRLARYRFTLCAREPMTLPAYKGCTLRGGFGYALKSAVCIRPVGQVCDRCLLPDTCPYAALFEGTRPQDAALLRKNTEVPLPFVIEPPLDRRTQFRPGETLDFDLVLIGRAIPYLAHFLVAFRHLGEAGIGLKQAKYDLTRVAARSSLNGSEAVVYEQNHLRLDEMPAPITFEAIAARAASLPTDRLTVRFLTPTRLKHADEYATRPDFHILIRALLRRVSSLAYFHCGERWETDYRGLIEQAQRVELAENHTGWVDWERYSTRQKQRMNLGGLVGEARYAGDLGPFLPLLALGELVHVGKACVFGNGKYELT